MSRINDDVKEAVETTHYITQAIIDLWNMLPVFMQIFLGMLVVTSLFMQFIKHAFLANKTKKRRKQLMWLNGMIAGIFLTSATFWLFNGEGLHKGYWALIGVSVSNVAMLLHTLTIKIIWPYLKKAKKLRIVVADDE